MKIFFIIFLSITSFSSFAAGAFDEPGYSPLSVNGCPAIKQFGNDHFADGSSEMNNCSGSTNPVLGFERIFRGGVPNQEGMKCLKSMGVTAVFDLQTENDSIKTGEATIAQNMGMTFFQFPMEASTSTPASKECAAARLSSAQCNQQSVVSFIQTLRDYLAKNPNAKVYVHCTRGQDRTGLALGFFRVKVQGCSKDVARTEMQLFLFNSFPPLQAVWNNIDQI